MKELRKFYDAAPDTAGGYGYQTDEVTTNPFNFGLNAGQTFMTKFAWIPNGGKDGAEQEALDIVFKINGTDKNYRMFPITKAFGANNVEITDPKAPEFKEALQDFNARITHILHAFMDGDTVRAKLSRPFSSFKEFAQFVETLLPQGYQTVALDIFLQYQWQLRDGQDRTYLEIPSKMKYGAWLKKSLGPQENWREQRVPNPNESVKKALWYVAQDGTEHPFSKNGWFMASNFANQQRKDGQGGYQGSAPAAQPMQQAAAPVAANPNATPQGSAW